MKKILFLGAMAAMLLGTASCSNDMEPAIGDGTVQFKVELPGAIDSRAISDGTTATKLDVACYDADGNVLTNLNPVVTPFNERVATVTVKLVKGQKYNFAFFAHADGAPYAFNAGTKLSECTFSVTDNYTGENCLSNAENRDAFYAVLTDYTVSAETKEVTLYRPFAQLNFGTDDLAAAEAAGITPGQSKVTVKQVATSFNLSTGKAATDGAVDATFALAARPAEKLVVDKEYDWMAMNYFLVPNNEANVNVEMTVNTNKQPVVVPVTSVPVKKNHRTNILGSLFTQEGKFNVIIDQDFDEPDNNVDYPEITDVAIVNGQQYETLDAAIAAAEVGATIKLTPGTYTFSSLNKSVKIVGTNKERSIVEFINKAYNCSGVDVYFENLTLKVGSQDYKGFQHSNSETYKNIIFEGGHLNLYGATATFDGCTFNQSTYDYCFWTYGATTTNVTNCVFNTVGKAVKVYKERDTAIHTFNISNSTFNVTSRAKDKIKAAIEIDGTLCPFAVNITNTTVNGHDPGETSGNILWNCDAGSKATVIVDGETVYQQN